MKECFCQYLCVYHAQPTNYLENLFDLYQWDNQVVNLSHWVYI